MIRVSVLPASARVAVAWRNGGGITREVAVAPPGAGLADFDWRISLAEVTEPGPFSLFEGVDRVLTVVRGQLLLGFAGGEVTVGEDAAPCAFAGDVACRGTPVGGAVTDLNVMTRRGRFAASVARVAGAFHAAGAPCVFVALGAGVLRAGELSLPLAAHDAAVTDAACALAFDGAGILVTINPVGAAGVFSRLA
jgi:environmental stress-induced protein Ves